MEPPPTKMQMQEAQTGIFAVPVAMGYPTEARRAHGSGAVVSFSTWRRLEARNYKLAACRNHLKPGLEAALQDMGTRCPHGHAAQNQPNFPASCTGRHRTGRGFRSRSPEKGAERAPGGGLSWKRELCPYPAAGLGTRRSHHGLTAWLQGAGTAAPASPAPALSPKLHLELSSPLPPRRWSAQTLLPGPPRVKHEPRASAPQSWHCLTRGDTNRWNEPLEGGGHHKNEVTALYSPPKIQLWAEETRIGGQTRCASTP